MSVYEPKLNPREALWISVPLLLVRMSLISASSNNPSKTTPGGEKPLFLCVIFRNCHSFGCYQHVVVDPHYPHLIQTMKQGKMLKFCQTLSKIIHLPSAEFQSRIYWQKSLTTETDANIWQPFADHPVHDTFLDSQLHRASRCTSLSPDDAGRLEPVVFDDDRMWQQRSE